MTDEEIFRQVKIEEDHFRWLNKVLYQESRPENVMLIERYLRAIDTQTRLVLKFKMLLRGKAHS